MINNKKVVLTYYYSGVKENHHKCVMKCNPKDFDVLRKSVDKSYDFVTLANELTPTDNNWEVVKLTSDLEKPKDMTLYVHKFIACYKWLLKHPEYNEIWIVDSSDTEMLSTPDPVDGVIYTGYDAYFPAFDIYATFLWFLGGPAKCGVWVPQGFGRGNRHGDFEVRYLRDLHLNDRPYNSGIFGGKREIVMEFLKDYADRLSKNDLDLEMVPFNYLCYTKYKDIVANCATRMTTGEKDYNRWWRHK